MVATHTEAMKKYTASYYQGLVNAVEVRGSYTLPTAKDAVRARQEAIRERRLIVIDEADAEDDPTCYGCAALAPQFQVVKTPSGTLRAGGWPTSNPGKWADDFEVFSGRFGLTHSDGSTLVIRTTLANVVTQDGGMCSQPSAGAACEQDGPCKWELKISMDVYYEPAKYDGSLPTITSHGMGNAGATVSPKPGSFWRGNNLCIWEIEFTTAWEVNCDSGIVATLNPWLQTGVAGGGGYDLRSTGFTPDFSNPVNDLANYDSIWLYLSCKKCAGQQ